MPALIQPRTPPGTLELLPREQMVFQHMQDVIRRGFERFGFVPVETPVFEFKDILLTKSGGETEKQVYFVQSTGAIKEGHEAELALRFDLTVPLARYVAEHEHQLAFPFRRYQIQRVYRGERAQKGRFREFYQCDIDVIGKDKLGIGYDAEIPAIIVQIFEELKIGDFTIHFSNRKILRGFLEMRGEADSGKQQLVLREIDKLDKIGKDKVREAVAALGLAPDCIDQLIELVSFKGTNEQIIQKLNELTTASEGLLREGFTELRHVADALKTLGVPENRARINLAIARGLDYYTGTVYETLIDDHPEFGSVCSGGRYDDLASLYTKSKLPGVGISIGLTRLYDQLTAHKLLPEQKEKTTAQVMIALLDMQPGEETQEALYLGTKLRHAGFNVENYWEQGKLDKKFKYADRVGVPFVIIVGPEELKAGIVKIKNMTTKEQFEVPHDKLVEKLRALAPSRP